MPCEFQIGDIVEVADKLDTDIKVTATVKYIEKDDEIPDLYWLYLVSNDISMNINFDSRIGNFWDMSANTSDYIRLISRATV